MGTSFYIGCLDCKVYRDLDKFYDLRHRCKNVDEVLEFQKSIAESSYRPALLISFLAEHLNHKCVAFEENAPIYEEICNEAREGKSEWKVERREFWR